MEPQQRQQHKPNHQIQLMYQVTIPLSHFVIQVGDEDASCLVHGSCSPLVRLQKVKNLTTSMTDNEQTKLRQEVSK